MNLPSHAAMKKVVVRHAKTAASSGCAKLSWECMAMMSSTRSDRHLGILRALGVDFLAPFSIVYMCNLSIFQGMLYILCQALMPCM